MIHLNWNESSVQKIISSTFPNQTCRKVQARIANTVRFSGTQWDSGCRDSYRIYELSTGKSVGIAEAPFLQKSALHDSDHEIPVGYLVVKYHQGRVNYFELIGPSENINPMLPAPTELSEDERIVLVATRSYKSSYGGQKNYRFYTARQKTGITQDRWEAAKEKLIKDKMLDKRGAITVSGRNAVESYNSL